MVLRLDHFGQATSISPCQCTSRAEYRKHIKKKTRTTFTLPPMNMEPDLRGGPEAQVSFYEGSSHRKVQASSIAVSMKPTKSSAFSRGSVWTAQLHGTHVQSLRVPWIED